VRYSSKPALQLSPGMPAHEALGKIHLALLSAILHNQEGVLKSRDPEFLHDFRVAIRRARSALSQIKGVFPAVDAEPIRIALSSMTRVTGPARDLDVLLEKLEVYESGFPEPVRRNLTPVKESARLRRREQQPVLARALNSDAWAEAVGRWETFLGAGTEPRTLPRKGQRPIGAVASKRIRKAYRRVTRRGSLAGLEIESLHRLRIDCKKLRYLLEFFRSLYPAREAASLIKSLKSLQGVLGDIHDLAVHQEMARRIWTALRPRPDFSLGPDDLDRRLEQLQAQAQDATEGRFQRFRAQTTPW
jgi:CHAD domain-containing protein